MEPRPHERGKATSAQSTTSVIDQASMEPRPHERGKIEEATTLSLSKYSFNGATSSRTWKDYGGAGSISGILASMEPRPHERGKRRTAASVKLRSIASMEPRPHERGKMVWKFPLKADAERASMEPRPHERGKRIEARRPERRSSFNGATSSRTWKDSSNRSSRPVRLLASMEPRPHERGKNYSARR